VHCSVDKTKNAKEHDMTAIDIVDGMNSLADYGARWVLWLLLAFSVLAIAIVIERAFVLLSTRADIRRLRAELRGLLNAGKEEQALQLLGRSKSVEARIAAAGLECNAAEKADERMHGEHELVRLELERGLAVLGTLGNNAPFIGLLGTVIGVVRAFRELNQQGAEVSAGLMAEIGEALIATAVGLLVALPAVAAFNALGRVVRSRLGQGDLLRHEVLAHLKGRTGQED
jgi:biopolymer transport protein ExbB